ncbi:MAG: nucleotidyltransferase domain-containing protein [Kiritimatiellae bacterium]|jgi:hypothetical protein|nr:nucleotidyltransferase domain-containing protein [Kiritimatiellia bacterium]
MRDLKSDNVRLTPFEKSALDVALEGVDGVVYLFGSRTNPSKRGGDIDLLIFSRSGSAYKLAQDVTVRFQMQCDEKIDVLVSDPQNNTGEERAFIDSIMSEAVLYEH